MVNSKNVVLLHTWWLGELQKLTQKVMNEESKRQEKMKTKVYAELDDYKSTDEILDAYGFGCITERKKDKLMALWEKRESELWEDPVYRMKLNMLQEMYMDSKQVIKDNGG